MFDTERKIIWELLSPSLQAKFNQMSLFCDKINKDIDFFKSYASRAIQDSINKTAQDIEALKKLAEDMIKALQDKLAKLLNMGEGEDATGDGIFYAYKYGKYGEFLKVDKRGKRILPRAIIIKSSISNASNFKIPELHRRFVQDGNKLYYFWSPTVYTRIR
nr:MAG TPA: hypothetical protein [Caudoviricetes sp.]